MIRAVERFAVALLLAASFPAAAQYTGESRPAYEGEPKSLIPKGARNGGWGGPALQISSVRSRAAVFVGGRGGWLLDGRLTIGLGGFGLANDIPAPPQVEAPGEELDLEMGYGGLWLEYTFSPLKLVHLSMGTLVGGGGLSLSFRGGGSRHSGTDAFFVVEPAVAAELNVVTHVRASLGLAYRVIAGQEIAGLSYSDVAGFSVVAVLKFGKF